MKTRHGYEAAIHEGKAEATAYLNLLPQKETNPPREVHFSKISSFWALLPCHHSKTLIFSIKIYFPLKYISGTSRV